MCDILKAIPQKSGKHNISQGTACVIGGKEGINLDIGSGTINTLTSASFALAGQYNFTIPLSGQHYQGDFNISLQLNPDGTVVSSINGTNYRGSYSCPGDSSSITFDLQGFQKFTLTYQEDSFTQKAKIWLNGLSFNGSSLDIYLYNSNYN